MKASATVYKGIEFVTIQELPAEQQFLLQTEHKIERIKILIDEKIVSNCIQYRHYVAWYNKSFGTFGNIKAAEQVDNTVLSSLAIGKI